MGDSGAGMLALSGPSSFGFHLDPQEYIDIAGPCPNEVTANLRDCRYHLSGMFSPEPMWAAYWSIVYLATILTAWTFVDGQFPVRSARTMLLITWAYTFLVAAYLGHSSSSLIFGHSVSSWNRPEAGLDKLSRSSGVARWAAVPGLVCVVRAI